MMNTAQLLVLVAALFFVCAGASDTPPSCGACDWSTCPKLGICPAGKVLDRCGCCEQCALREGDQCSTNAEELALFDQKCGIDLECVPRTDVQFGKDERPQSTCKCVNIGEICATDNRTYSICQFAEQQVITDSKIKIRSYTACVEEPQFYNKEKDQTIEKGAKVTFLCETSGFPVPKLTWYFKGEGRRDDESIELPDEHPEVSVTTRGDTRKRRLNSYLQITDFNEALAGTYLCLVENDLKIKQYKFKVKYTEKKDKN